MVLALFSQEINESVNDVIQSFFISKFSKESKFYVEKKLYDQLAFDGDLELIPFNKSKDLDSSIDLLVSIGGDGTFLRTIEYVRDLNIPVMGINTGNLGFLATIKKENLDQAVEKIYNKKFKVENRSVIKVNSEEIGLPKNLFPYALNEISVVRKDTTSMINIKTSLDGNHLNSYWADGLIISTPTGSTGYSLSCGGPIIMPDSKNLVLTPIAPHNLNARPLVISDNKQIEISINGRENEYFVSADSQIFSVNIDSKINISKAPYFLKMVEFEEDSYINTLREKLMWGKDRRTEQ